MVPNVLVLLGLLLGLAACGDGGTPDVNATAPTTDTATTTATTEGPGMTADDIAVAHTPPGGYGDTVPPPVLASCTEPLIGGAPDLRGWWRVVEVTTDDGTIDTEHRALGLLQRIEQCGDRLVVTAAGVIHDMRCDGTEENGVNDVAEMDKTTPITVVATYEDGVHVLRPVGIPVEVTRRRDGEHALWTYVGFTARLELVGPPDALPPEPTAEEV